MVTYKAKLQEYPLLIDFKNNTDTLLTVEEKIYSGDDFYAFAQTFQKRTREDLYEEFTNKMIIDYFKDHLDETNKEFALTYKEYEDGLLLFELLQKKVWERSEKDSTGLASYFEANRNNYVWKKRAELTIASCTRLEKAQQVRDMLLRNIPSDSIKSTVNEGATIHVLFSKGKLEEGSSKLPQEYTFAMGVSDIFEEDKMDFTIIDVDTIFEPELKDLKETRGEVMNDYQNYLEKEWVKELHEAYQVKVNQRNYKELKKRLTSQ